LTGVDIVECAGMLDLKFQYSDGTPVLITSGGSMRAYLETVPGSGSYDFLQAYRPNLRSSFDQEFMAVRGGGNYRIDIYRKQTIGSDPAVDLIKKQSLKQVYVTVGCDEIVEILCVLPDDDDGTGILPGLPPEELGEIVGVADMLGEDEHPISSRTFIQADGGPYSNLRYDAQLGVIPGVLPSEGPYWLQNMLPSDAVSPPLDYRVWGEMNFREGRRFEYFRMPWLENHGVNSRVTVTADQTTDLGNTYVMDPGFVAGDLLFAGPPAAAVATGSVLEDIYRSSDDDDDGNGIPNNASVYYGSRVMASGSSTASVGSTLSAYGGEARVEFEGDFNSLSDNFEGDYELVLAGLNQEASRWQRNYYWLLFRDTATPEVPTSYQVSNVRVLDNTLPEVDIVPGTTLEVDFAQCYSQVNLGFLSTGVPFYNPRLSANGTFVGDDFQMNPVDYQVHVSTANGTPVSLDDADITGLVVMALPQGSYTFKPWITSLNPGGGTSTTQLPEVVLDVGCGQIIDFNSAVQVNLDSLPDCSEDELLTVTGDVTGGSEIARVYYTLNGGPEVDICVDCTPGDLADISFDVDLDECDNEIELTAVSTLVGMDGSPISASVTDTARFDNVAPVIEDCPGNQTFDATETDGSIPVGMVEFATTAIDNCEGAVDVVCAPELEFVPMGTTTFTCTATDECGNVSECEFDVTVVPPECYMVIGPSSGSSSFVGAQHTFDVQLSEVEDSYVAFLADVPEFVLPSAPSARTGNMGGGMGGVVQGGRLGPSHVGGSPEWMQDGHFTFQILMWNPAASPAMPEMYTAGIEVEILPGGEIRAAPYGDSLGAIHVWSEVSENSDGQKVISFPFEFNF